MYEYTSPPINVLVTSMGVKDLMLLCAFTDVVIVVAFAASGVLFAFRYHFLIYKEADWRMARMQRI